MKVDSKETAVVVFAGTEKYFRPGSVEQIEAWERSGELLPLKDHRQLVYKGRKEVIMECKDPVLLDKLCRLTKEQDTFLPKVKPIQQWLDKEGIAWYEEPAKSTLI
jgi:hypothetical protein